MPTARRHSRTSRRSSRGLSLLLAVILAVVPWLSPVQAGQSLPEGAAPASGAQMPCHPPAADGLQMAHAPQHDDCPHCTGDAPAGQCHCVGQGVPAGLSTTLPAFGLPIPALTLPGDRLCDTLPDSPSARLYRPPAQRI